MWRWKRDESLDVRFADNGVAREWYVVKKHLSAIITSIFDGGSALWCIRTDNTRIARFEPTEIRLDTFVSRCVPTKCNSECNKNVRVPKLSEKYDVFVCSQNDTFEDLARNGHKICVRMYAPRKKYRHRT